MNNNEIEEKMQEILRKIEREQRSIEDCNKSKRLNQEMKKLKTFCGVYILFFIIALGCIGMLIFAQLTYTSLDEALPNFIFTLLSVLGILASHLVLLVLHSVICYKDYTADNALYAFGFGLLNLVSFGVWGLIKSIKNLANKTPSTNAELAKNARRHADKIAQLRQELKDFDASQNQ